MLTDWFQGQGHRPEGGERSSGAVTNPRALGYKSVWYKFSPDPQHVLTYVHAFLRVVKEHHT